MQLDVELAAVDDPVAENLLEGMVLAAAAGGEDHQVHLVA